VGENNDIAVEPLGADEFDNDFEDFLLPAVDLININPPAPVIADIPV
jgi:hypothetical protein